MESCPEDLVRLLEDENAYREVIADFVDCRLSAERFVPRFRHLWNCDRTLCADVAANPPDRAGVYGLLDGVNTLCDTYSDALGAGMAYRVSAEQFRKEVDCLTRDSVLR